MTAKRAAVMRCSRELVEALLPPGKVIDCVADKVGPVDYDWLRRALLLPDDCRITGVSASLFFDWDQVAIRVESEAFVET